MNSKCEHAWKILQNLGHPVVFKQIYDEVYPPRMISYCASPKRFFEIFDQQSKLCEYVKDYVPIWEINRECIVSYDVHRSAYVEYYYGDTEDRVIGKTYQQFMTNVLWELVGSGEWGASLENLASLFEYKHLDKLIEFSKSVPVNSYLEECRRFAASIPD